MLIGIGTVLQGSVFDDESKVNRIHLEFVIDEPYFIAHLLINTNLQKFSSEKYVEDLQAFKEHMTQIADKEVQTLMEYCRADWKYNDGRFYYSIHPDELKLPEMESLVAKAKQSAEYDKLLNQTIEYLDLCKRQWLDNYDTTAERVKAITGFSLQRKITVYISHPGLHTGRCLGDRKIAWGNREDFPNYTTIYLWHEILHTYFEFDHGINHSLIQFIADNELRTLLNGGTYPLYVGHKDLFETMELIQPYWEEYLQSSHRDILRFAEQLKQELNIASLPHISK